MLTSPWESRSHQQRSTRPPSVKIKGEMVIMGIMQYWISVLLLGAGATGTTAGVLASRGPQGSLGISLHNLRSTLPPLGSQPAPSVGTLQVPQKQNQMSVGRRCLDLPTTPQFPAHHSTSHWLRPREGQPLASHTAKHPHNRPPAQLLALESTPTFNTPSTPSPR